MTGRRRDVEPSTFEPGDYGRWLDRWFCKTPANADGESYLGDLTQHEVVEYEDGTITVSPSILVTSGGRTERERWHGYLERGVWRTV